MDVEIYKHTLQDLDGLLKSLQPTLPHSLSLYRRLQLSKTQKRETAAWATFPPSCNHHNSSSVFAVGFLDYTSPSIHAYIFSSLEMLEPPGEASPDARAQEMNKSQDLAFSQVIAILCGFRSHSEQLVSGNPQAEDVILIGTVHSKVAALLRTYGTKHSPGFVRDDIGGPGGPYGKHVSRVSGSPQAAEEDLPPSLYYDSIKSADHDLIIENNDIVQNSQSLRYLPYGIGIRSAETGTLAAWAFLGVDACVRTLHVMPERRRLGLGRKVATKALREGLSAFGITDGEKSEAWWHVDISGSNIPSLNLFQSLGARWTLDAFWMRVDLTKLPSRHDS